MLRLPYRERSLSGVQVIARKHCALRQIEEGHLVVIKERGESFLRECLSELHCRKLLNFDLTSQYIECHMILISEATFRNNFCCNCGL